MSRTFGTFFNAGRLLLFSKDEGKSDVDSISPLSSSEG